MVGGLPLFIDRTEEIQRCVAYLPEKVGGEIEPSYYCRDCRTKLTKVATQGYVLLDLYDLNEIQVYPVEDGAEPLPSRGRARVPLHAAPKRRGAAAPRCDAAAPARAPIWIGPHRVAPRGPTVFD